MSPFRLGRRHPEGLVVEIETRLAGARAAMRPHERRAPPKAAQSRGSGSPSGGSTALSPPRSGVSLDAHKHRGDLSKQEGWVLDADGHGSTSSFGADRGLSASRAASGRAEPGLDGSGEVWLLGAEAFRQSTGRAAKVLPSARAAGPAARPWSDPG